MKYKSTLSPPLKNFIEWKLEHYQEDKRMVEEYKRDLIPSPTPAYSESIGAHDAQRSTENVALKIITNSYILQLTKSCDAIEHVLSKLDDADFKLIDIVYWRRSYNIVGAAQIVNMSLATAYRHIDAILSAIAAEMGLVSVKL